MGIAVDLEWACMVGLCHRHLIGEKITSEKFCSTPTFGEKDLASTKASFLFKGKKSNENSKWLCNSKMDLKIVVLKPNYEN